MVKIQILAIAAIDNVKMRGVCVFGAMPLGTNYLSKLNTNVIKMAHVCITQKQQKRRKKYEN